MKFSYVLVQIIKLLDCLNISFLNNIQLNDSFHYIRTFKFHVKFYLI